MNTSTDDGDRKDNMEAPGQEAACAPGCDCHATGSASRIRRIVGVVVLLGAIVLVARAATKDTGTPTPTDGAVFAASQVTGVPSDATSESASTAKEDGPTDLATPRTPAPESVSAAEADAEKVVGKEITAFSDLNNIAADTDAVFVFLPSREKHSGKAPSSQLQGAARTIEAQGTKVDIFTLTPGSRDYDQVSKQVAAPAVLAMVKGRGMSAVSGDITETKLVQAFVAASRGGGCGPAAAGCGPSGCN